MAGDRDRPEEAAPSLLTHRQAPEMTGLSGGRGEFCFQTIYFNLCHLDEFSFSKNVTFCPNKTLQAQKVPLILSGELRRTGSRGCSSRLSTQQEPQRQASPGLTPGRQLWSPHTASSGRSTGLSSCSIPERATFFLLNSSDLPVPPCQHPDGCARRVR